MGKIKDFLLQMVISMGIGFVFGMALMFMKDRTEEALEINLLVFVLWFLIGCVVNISLHELGHMIAGLLSGYKFCSFRIFQFTWVLEDKKIRLKRYSIQGTAGQCLMLPPGGKDLDYPVFFYNMGGVIMNLVTSIVLVVLGFALQHEAFFVIAMSGIFYLFLNGIPMKINGIANDGENAFHLKKDRVAMQAVDVQLRCNALQMEGMRLRDMPEEYFEIGEEPDWKNIHVCTLKYLNICRKSDMENYEECEADIKEFLGRDTALLELYRDELKCELIFIYIKLGKLDEAEALYNEMRKYLKKTKMFLEHYPIQYGYFKLIKNDEEKAWEILEAYNKKKKSYPYKTAIVVGDEAIEEIDYRAKGEKY